jgi:hypothetical protein
VSRESGAIHFLAQAPFGTNAVAIAHDQHSDHQFGVNRGASYEAVVIRKVLTQFTQIEDTVDAAKQVGLRNVVFEVEGVEQPFLPPFPMPHHFR